MHMTLSVGQKIKAYNELLKPRLSFLVAFSSGIGYVLATQGNILSGEFFVFLIGGFLISGASVTINQVIEKRYDAIMSRTKNRPIPSGRIVSNDALVFAIVVGIIGFSLLAISSNLLATIISLVSLLLYSFVYTPLKRVGPIAVFVGAIPGALPPLIGWVAVTGALSYEAWIIFGIQFAWQFPHFWAIAWLS